VEAPSAKFDPPVQQLHSGAVEYVDRSIQTVFALATSGSELEKRTDRPGGLELLHSEREKPGTCKSWGAMTGIRNPKAHTNIQIDAMRALHFLMLASLLTCKIGKRIK